MFMKLHKGTKVLQELGQRLFGGILAPFCLCPGNFSEGEFKSNELICLETETSRHLSIKAIAWMALNAFSLVYIKNSEQKNVKMCNLMRREVLTLKVATELCQSCYRCSGGQNSKEETAHCTHTLKMGCQV